MPLVEALTMQVPVIASGAYSGRWRATFPTLDPLDGPGWMARIRAYSQAPGERDSQLVRIAQFGPPVDRAFRPGRPLPGRTGLNVRTTMSDSPRESGHPRSCTKSLRATHAELVARQIALSLGRPQDGRDAGATIGSHILAENPGRMAGGCILSTLGYSPLVVCRAAHHARCNALADRQHEQHAADRAIRLPDARHPVADATGTRNRCIAPGEPIDDPATDLRISLASFTYRPRRRTIAFRNQSRFT